MENLLNSIVLEELAKLQLKDKMTGFLVKKKKRGTFQALEECDKAEQKITEDLTIYIRNWVRNELVGGKFKEAVVKELLEQVKLELYRQGFIGIF